MSLKYIIQQIFHLSALFFFIMYIFVKINLVISFASNCAVLLHLETCYSQYLKFSEGVSL